MSSCNTSSPERTPLHILHVFWKDDNGHARVAVATVVHASGSDARLQTEHEFPVGLTISCNDPERGYCRPGAVQFCDAESGGFVVGLSFGPSETPKRAPTQGPFPRTARERGSRGKGGGAKTGASIAYPNTDLHHTRGAIRLSENRDPAVRKPTIFRAVTLI
jgi:hypothetical protein